MSTLQWRQATKLISKQLQWRKKFLFSVNVERRKVTTSSSNKSTERWISTMTSFCTEHSNCEWLIASRVVIVLFYVIACLVTNSVVLYVYRKKSKNEAGKLYIVALAWLDCIACCMSLPLVPFWEFGLLPDYIFHRQAVLGNQMYLFVQVAMVLDRVCAVYTPFKYLKNRDRMNRVMLAIFIAIQLYLQAIAFISKFIIRSDLLYLISGLSFSATFVVGLLVIACAYPAIVCRLHNQQKRVHGTAPTSNVTGRSSTTAPIAIPSNDAKKRRTSHVKILKLYGGVVGLYVFTHIPVVLAALFEMKAASYLFFINNVGNAFIIYMFNDSFRNDVNQLLRNLKKRLCGAG